MWVASSAASLGIRRTSVRKRFWISNQWHWAWYESSAVPRAQLCRWYSCPYCLAATALPSGRGRCFIHDVFPLNLHGGMPDVWEHSQRCALVLSIPVSHLSSQHSSLIQCLMLAKKGKEKIILGFVSIMGVKRINSHLLTVSGIEKLSAYQSFSEI